MSNVIVSVIVWIYNLKNRSMPWHRWTRDWK